MKTILTFVVTLVLGAMLVSCAPPAPALAPAEATCQDLLGPGPREAVVLVMLGTDGRCMLKTVPNRLEACLGDELLWKAAYIKECSEYAGRLEIGPKEGVSAEMNASPGNGEATASIRIRPTTPTCGPEGHCRIPYKVTLRKDAPSEDLLEEDPRIDIW